MKKYFIITCVFLVIATFISGCTAGVEDKQSYESAKPNPIDATPIPIKMFVPEVTAGLDYSEYYNDFMELIKDKFNIELSLVIPSMWDDYIEMAKESDIFLCNLQNLHSERKFLIDNNIIIPFNDYLTNSSIWKDLPDNIKYSFTDGYGIVWAIPYNDTANIWARAIRKDWLNNTGLSTPTTIGELYNLMQVFTYNDPDMNGKSDTFGSGLSDRMIRLFNFKDIFEANGCYFSYSWEWTKDFGVVLNYMIPGYNPDTGRIEDNLDNPGFMESLEMIEAMLDNNLIDLQADTLLDGVISNPNIGTHMGLVKDNIIYPDMYEYCYSLEGLKKSKTATVLYGDNQVFYLTSHTRNPEKVVPSFLEMMYGDDVEGYKLLHYGPLGNNRLYSVQAGKIVKNNVNEQITSNLELIGDLSWMSERLQIMLPDGAVRQNVEKILSNDHIMELSHIQMALLEYTTEVINRLPDGSMPMDPKFYYKDLITLNEKLLYQRAISARDFYNELKKLHLLYGMDLWISETNQRWLGDN